MPVDHKSLRINNYIYFRGSPKRVYMIDDAERQHYQINDLAINRASGVMVNGGEDIFNPIPISSDILEASGFTYDENKDWWYIQPDLQNVHFRVKHNYEDVWLFSKGFFNWNDELNEGRYIHKMQNVYFEILDQELNIIFP